MRASQRSLLVSVLAGLSAFALHTVYVRHLERGIEGKYGELTNVVVARDPIDAGTRLDDRNIEEVQVPANFVQPGAFTSVHDAIGQLTAAPILPREQVLESKLVGSNAAQVAAFVDVERRAFPVVVDDALGIATLISPRDRVDVLGTFELQGEKEKAVNKVVLQNAMVLAVGARLPGDPLTGRGARGQDADGGFGGSTRVVSLEVSLADAQRLALAQETGVLMLAVRSALDEGRQLGDESGVRQIDTGALVDGTVATPIRKPIMIRGGRRESD